MEKVTLPLEPLTKDSFAPYGDIIDINGASPTGQINQGTAQRYDDIFTLDYDEAGGRACVCFFVSQPRPMPIELEVLEKHPLGSQAFLCQSGQPFLVVVADASLDSPQLEDLHAFLVPAGVGVNIKRNVWHHPLLSLYPNQSFLIIERAPPKDGAKAAPKAPPQAPPQDGLPQGHENLAFTALPKNVNIFVNPPL